MESRETGIEDSSAWTGVACAENPRVQRYKMGDGEQNGWWAEGDTMDGIRSLALWRGGALY